MLTLNVFQLLREPFGELLPLGFAAGTSPETRRWVSGSRQPHGARRGRPVAGPRVPGRGRSRGHDLVGRRSSLCGELRAAGEGGLLAERRGRPARGVRSTRCSPTTLQRHRTKCEMTKWLLADRAESREGAVSPRGARRTLGSPRGPGHHRARPLWVQRAELARPRGQDIRAFYPRRVFLPSRNASFGWPGVSHGVVKLWSGHRGPRRGAWTTRLVTWG